MTMDPAVQLFLAFVAIGLLLIGIEVFVPGGILGVFGALSLVAAIITGFAAFGPKGGFFAGMAIIIFSGVFLAVWIKFFPGTRFGKTLTLQADGHTFKSAAPDLAELTGREGTAQTDLHPAGLALIDGHRTDVVTESGYVSAGARVRVVRVEGNRVVVREVASS